jgi:hypothetical protein
MGKSMSARRTYLAFLIALACAPLWADAPAGDDYVKGFDLYAHRDYANSILYLKAAVGKNPQDWKAWEIMGFDYYLLNQPAQALPAFDQSLRWNPKNPQLWTLAEGIRARIIWEAERNDPYPRVFRNPDNDIWVKLRGGFISAGLGDLPKSVPAFQSYYTNLYGHASASVDGFGPLAGLEVGFMLDTYNAWGVAFEGASFNGYQASANDNFGNTLKGSIQPDMLSIQAEYYRFFKLGSTRLWAGAGAGFYATIAELSYVQNAVTLQSGEMAGLGYGGFLGLGWDIALGDQFSAGLYVRGRYATTGDIEGLIAYNNGTSQQSVLISDNTGAYAVPTGTAGAKPINVDYTGMDAGLGICYHY